MKLLLQCLIAGFTWNASAAYSHDLYAFFNQRLSEVQNSVKNQQGAVDGSIPPMLLQDINVDLAPTVSFGITGFLSLAISPEIDFVLVPDGSF